MRVMEYTGQEGRRGKDRERGTRRGKQGHAEGTGERTE